MGGTAHHTVKKPEEALKLFVPDAKPAHDREEGSNENCKRKERTIDALEGVLRPVKGPLATLMLATQAKMRKRLSC